MKIFSYLKDNILTILLIVLVILSTSKISDKISTLSSPIYQGNNYYTEPSLITEKQINTTLSENEENLIISSKITLKEVENNSKVYLCFTGKTSNEAYKEVELKNVGGLAYEGNLTLEPKGTYSIDLLIKGDSTTKSISVDTLNLTEIAKEQLPINLFSVLTSSDNTGNFSYSLQGENLHNGNSNKKLKVLQAAFYYKNEEILFIDLLKNGEIVDDYENKTIYKLEGSHKLNVVYGDNWTNDLNISMLAITQDGKEYTKTLQGPN